VSSSIFVKIFAFFPAFFAFFCFFGGRKFDFGESFVAGETGNCKPQLQFPGERYSGE